jgi:serine/threonine-protein kinase
VTDVFLSYKAEDRPRLALLVEALEADGLSVWWDAHIGGGDQWRQTIQRHLDSARCVVVAWSKGSAGPNGQFVCDEAARAQRRGVYLPVRIDKVDPPLGFGETQALNLVGWKGDRADPRYQAVLKTARAKLGLKPQAVESRRPTPGISRRGAIAAGGTAALAAGVAGSWFFLGSSPAKANSIAVLPFANLSGDPAQAYFSDGMAEELRSALSRIAGLIVVARTSSEIVRDADAKTAARKLGVANILTGSVRRSQSTIRVNAQLVDGKDGIERWSQSFDRPSGDVLQIQTGIAESVAQALSIRLAGADSNVLSLGGTRNPAAQDLFFQARPERLADTKAGLQQAIALLEAAIALDPNFAAAHATKAIRLSIWAGTYALSAAQSQQGQTQALASANRAIAIAPRLASGYAARALIYSQQLNMGAALADLVKADALPGSEADTLRNYASVLGLSRRPEEAWRMSTKATRLDPLNPVSFETQAVTLYHARRYAEAAATARRSLQLSPERQRVRSYLANALLALNKDAEAETEYRKLEPTDYRRLLGQAVLAVRAGDRASAITTLRAMKQRYGDSAYYQYGEIYAQLGSNEQAIAELESALAKRDPGMARIRVDPFLDPIRRDPRFAAIERKLNFP